MNKIAVINFSGNVGKSTVAHYLLSPRMDNAPVISVESINAGSENTETLRGSEFDDVQDRMLATRKAIVDIGSSNVEDFVELMKSYENSHEDFDMFIVPVVAAKKQQTDTIQTLIMLSRDIGIPKDRIKLVFNMVDRRDNLHKVFSRIFEYHEQNKNFILNPNAVIYDNPLFEKLKDTDKSIVDINNDPTDYLEKNELALDNNASEEEKAEIRMMIALKRLAGKVTSELDMVFEELNN